jgi:hypothetical protein
VEYERNGNKTHMFTKSARLGGKDQNSRALFGSCASLPVRLSPGDHPPVDLRRQVIIMERRHHRRSSVGHGGVRRVRVPRVHSVSSSKRVGGNQKIG